MLSAIVAVRDVRIVIRLSKNSNMEVFEMCKAVEFGFDNSIAYMGSWSPYALLGLLLLPVLVSLLQGT